MSFGRVRSTLHDAVAKDREQPVWASNLYDPAMESCWESGGPDWLFGLMLGSMLAAGVACAYAFSAELRHDIKTPPRHRVIWLVLGVLTIVNVKADLASVIAVLGPPLVVGAAILLTRRTRLAAASTSTEGLLSPSRLPFLVLGMLSAVAAVGSEIYMRVAGGPC